MNRRRYLYLVVLFLAVTTLATGTSGFSASAADRDATVNIAEDRDAYLGFDQARHSNENETTNVTQREDPNGTTYVVVTVVNQFPSGTELTRVEITANGTSVDLAPLASGERGKHTFSSVSCGDQIRIAASGDSVAVRLTRTALCN